MGELHHLPRLRSRTWRLAVLAFPLLGGSLECLCMSKAMKTTHPTPSLLIHPPWAKDMAPAIVSIRLATAYGVAPCGDHPASRRRQKSSRRKWLLDGPKEHPSPFLSPSAKARIFAWIRNVPKDPRVHVAVDSQSEVP